MGAHTHEQLSVYNNHIHDDCSSRQRSEHIKRAFVARMADESGQSTIEYAVVLSGFLLVVVALALFVSAAREGAFIRLAREACAYVADNSFVSTLQDALLF